jgi:Cadherin-like beta sandwich domain
MRYHSSQRNIVWTVLFSILLVVTLNACGDSNNVTGPPPPVPLSPDAKLSSLTVTSGPLGPAFSSDVANYSVEVATSVTSVTVTARAQNTGATVNINGQAATSQPVSIGAPGSSTAIPIVVTAVSGSQNTYIVTVNRTALGGNNNLRSLTVTPGSLAPPFTANTRRYTVSVDSTAASVLVTAQPQDAGAVVSINDQPTTSLSVPLEAAGTNTQIDIDVTAPNGSQKTYTVVVNRAAIVLSGNSNLSALVVSAGAFVPAFVATITSYGLTVPNSTADTTVTATVADSTATLTINGSPVTSGVTAPSIALAVGQNSITIVVTAGNGAINPYTVTITREDPPAP